MIRQDYNLKNSFYQMIKKKQLSFMGDIYFVTMGDQSQTPSTWSKIFGNQYKEISLAEPMQYTETIAKQTNDRLRELPSVDFIRIDTAQHGLGFLSSIKDMIGPKGTLGIEINLSFFESDLDDFNQYSAIDHVLKPLGFILFDMNIQKEPRKTLSYNLDDVYKQVPGPVQSATALYFRDLGDTDYEKKFNFIPDKNHLIKLACLLDIYDFGDCTAELIINHQKTLKVNDLEKTALLDHLTPPLHGKKLSYSTYINKFEKDPKKWFPKTTTTSKIKSFIRGIITCQ